VTPQEIATALERLESALTALASQRPVEGPLG
jgi:hypothetical protein